MTATEMPTELRRVRSTMAHMLTYPETIAPKAVSTFSGRGEIEAIDDAIAKAEGKT